MLTIKSPIEIKCGKPMVASGEAFYHKITGNYQMMNATIGREDLLHMVTAPPEVYIGEGGMTNIVNTNSVQAVNENNLEIVNNLVNRIALTENVDLTYQDRVYITSMLNKLGVQDVKQFMSQVTKLKQETQNTEQLISLYWTHLSELTEIVNDFNSFTNEQSRVTEQKLEQHSTNLHRQIMNRLQTGAVYQVLNNFYASHNHSNSYVTNEEFQLVEQKRVASNILLNRLKDAVNSKEVPFIYHHDNYYETELNGDALLTTEAVTEQITSAVLLNLVDNLYLSRFEKLINSPAMWLHIENSLYQTAENTLWRMRNQSESYNYRTDSREAVQNYLRYNKREEIQSIENLLTLRREEEINELFEEQNYYELVNQLAEQYRQSAETQPDKDSVIFEQIENRATEILKERYFERQVRYFNEMHNYMYNLDRRSCEQTQNISLEYRNEYDTTNVDNITEQAEQTDILNRIYNDAYNQVVKNYIQQRAEEAVKSGEFTPQSEAATVQNITENRLLTEQYQSPLNLVSTQVNTEDIQVTEQSEVNVDKSAEGDITHLEVQNQGDEITLIQQQLQQINKQNLANYNQYVQMRQQQVAQSKERPAVRSMRADSLKALENPAQLMEEFRKENEDKQTAGQQELKQIVSILPEETRRIYEKLEQQRAAAQHPASPDGITQTNLGLLMQDIHQVETQTRQEEQQILEHTETVRETSNTEIERWAERTAAKPASRTVTQQSRHDVTLVHKKQENTIDEETIAQLIEQNRTVQNITKKTTERVEQTSEVINKTVQTNKNINIQQTQDIDTLIRQGVQKQMGELSDRIYTRLERKLENERKRRGY